MKVIFLRLISLSVGSILLLQLGIANAAEDKKKTGVPVSQDDRNLSGISKPVRSGSFGSTKFYSASQFRTTANQSSVIGDVGVQIGTGHHIYFRGQRVVRENGTSVEKYGVSYRWKFHRRTSLMLKSTSMDFSSGRTRTDFGFDLRQSIPTKLVASAVNLGYKSVENVHTQLEARYTASKNIHDSPLRLTTNIKWRQRESSTGTVVGDIGGSVVVRFNLKSRVSIALAHNVRDDIGPESTTLSGSFAKRIGRNKVTFNMGAANEKTAFFGVQSLLDF